MRLLSEHRKHTVEIDDRDYRGNAIRRNRSKNPIHALRFDTKHDLDFYARSPRVRLAPTFRTTSVTLATEATSMSESSERGGSSFPSFLTVKSRAATATLASCGRLCRGFSLIGRAELAGQSQVDDEVKQVGHDRRVCRMYEVVSGKSASTRKLIRRRRRGT